MNKYLKYIFLIPAAAVLSGCLRDSHSDVRIGNGFVEVELGLEIVDEAESLTRAGLTWDQEYGIETLDLLIFKYNSSTPGQSLFRYATHGYDIKNTAGSRSKKYKAMLATEYYDAGGTKISMVDESFFIMTLANSRDVWSVVKETVKADDTFTDIMAKLIFDASDTWDTTTPRYLPMSTSVGLNIGRMTANLKSSDIGPAVLLRSVAALDIGFYAGGSETPYAFSDFIPKEVILCNLNDRGLVSHWTAAGTNQIYSGTNPNVTYVRIPSSATLTERTYEFSSSAGSFSEIYIPESYAVDFTSPSRPYLLLYGLYGQESVESWYKIEFPSWYDVLKQQYGSSSAAAAVHRNFRYVFKIERIDGPGYGSREEAEAGEGKPAGLWLNATVVPFSERTVVPETNSNYIFDVSQTSFFFEEPRSNYSATLDLYTDYAEGWRVDDITYEVDPGSRFWLRTDVIKGVPFVQGQLGISVDYNYFSDEGRVAYIHLSAGRWKYQIRVQQGEIRPTYLDVSPTSRTISFWSHRNGATPQNTFTVDTGGADWTYSVSHTGGNWGLEVHKTDDGNGFYVQCDRNETTGVRRANVTVTSGGYSVVVPITQDWADCGIGGQVALADFGGTQPQVKTHLFGGNALRTLMRWWENAIENLFIGIAGENWRENPELVNFYEGLYEEFYTNEYQEWEKELTDKEYYACWMLENSKYGTYDVLNYNDDPTQVGPYYSYAHAPSACPPGWKLPEFWELIAIANMGLMLDWAEPDSDEILAVDLWRSQTDAFTGGYHNYGGGDYEWHGWGDQGFFHTTWDGIFHLNPETQHNYTAPIALYLGSEPLIDGNAAIDIPGPMGPDSKFAVRCVRDATYSYE